MRSRNSVNRLKMACVSSVNMTYLWHMRTTIELPDELMMRAKIRAVEEGISLREFFISAAEQRLMPIEGKKTRRELPIIIKGGPVRDATAEELAEAATPSGHILEQIERSRR